MSVTRPGWMDLNADETPEDVVLPVEVRVKQGMARLDEAHGPEWVHKIDVDTLDLRDTCRCVLGQLYGRHRESFTDGVDSLRIAGQPACDLGFDESFGASQNVWPALTTAWRSAILARRLELTQVAK